MVTSAPATLFSAQDYSALAAIVFRPDYPGNATARGVVEAPNGDSAARDTGKRYSHIAVKYLRQFDEIGRSSQDILDYESLYSYLENAHRRSLDVACALGVPDAFMPSFEYGALRVLEYPPGAGSHVHTDFDLFTLMAYRDDDQGLRRMVSAEERSRLDAVDRGLHLGELGEIVGLGDATPHQVWAAEWWQHSIVYFAIPDHVAVLPSGVTVGDWLTERLARSRYEAEAGQS